MSKAVETSSFITKRLSQSEIRRVLREPLRKAKNDSIHYDALAEPDDIGIVAEEKVAFRTFSAVQIAINADSEEQANVIDVTAMWDRIMTTIAVSAAKGDHHSKSSSLKLKRRIEDALRAADPELCEIAF